MITSFIPPKYIRELQTYNYKDIDTIPTEVFEKISQKMKALQSDEPVITIGLIAWNEQDYLLATLASMAEIKSEYPIEIIVVNNNSTDNTQRILDLCGVKSFFEKKQGYGFARQTTLKNAKGQYFISADADSLYLPNWADALVKPMMDDKGITCTFTSQIIYTDNQKYPLSLRWYQRAKMLSFRLKNIKRPQFNVRGSSMAFRTAEARKVGGYNTDVARGEDGYLALLLSDYGKVKMISNMDSVIYTNYRGVSRDGSLFQAFLKRMWHDVKNLPSLFKTQKERL